MVSILCIPILQNTNIIKVVPFKGRYIPWSQNLFIIQKATSEVFLFQRKHEKKCVYLLTKITVFLL